ncbi:MAG: diguanylate cyclase [Bryobacterales bacterium]|nr:diguanylate cyclase [Bryobacterales bacterium]
MPEVVQYRTLVYANSRRSRVESLLDEMPVGLALLNRDRSVQHWNRAAEALSGRHRHTVVGSRWEDGLLVALRGCAMRRTFLRHREGHLLAVEVSAHRLPPALAGADATLATLIAASPVMPVLEHARGNPELDLLDTMTGLGNRRLAAQELESYLIRHQLQRWPFGLALFDIDSMQALNARHGFECGDRILRASSLTLAACLDASDVLCRWGGEQFLALLHGSTAAVEAKAELCRAAIEQVSLQWLGTPVAFTISGGVEMAGTGDHPHDLIGHAAYRLRMSKRLGRNRITGCPAGQAE